MHYTDLLPPKGLACIVGSDAKDDPTGKPQFVDLEAADAAAQFDAVVARIVNARRSVFVAYYALTDRARLASGSRANAGADASHLSLVCDVDVDPSKPECFANKDDMVQALIRAEEIIPSTACISSGGGTHLYWRLDKPLSHAKRNAAQQALRGALHGIDPRLVADPRRMKDAGVLRAPNTVNFKAEYGPAGAPVEFWWHEGPTYKLGDLLTVCAGIAPSPAMHLGDVAMATALAVTPQPTGPSLVLPQNEGRFQRGAYALKDVVTKCELFQTYTLDHAQATQGRREITTRNDGSAWEVVLQLGAFVKGEVATMAAYAQAQAYATPDDEAQIAKRLNGWRSPPTCARMREMLLGMAPEVAGVPSNCAICARCPLTVKSGALHVTPLDAVDYDKKAALVAQQSLANAAAFLPPLTPALFAGPTPLLPPWLDANELNRVAGVDYASMTCPISPAVGDTVIIDDGCVASTRLSGKTMVRAQGFRLAEMPLLSATAGKETMLVIGKLAPGQPQPVGLTNIGRALVRPETCRPVMSRTDYRNQMMQHALASGEDASRVFNAMIGLATNIGRVNSSCQYASGSFTLPACRVTDSGDVAPTLWADNPDALLAPGFEGTFAEHRTKLQWCFDHATPEATLAMMAAFISPLYAMLPEYAATSVLSLSGRTGTGKSLLATIMGKVWDTAQSRIAYRDFQGGSTQNALQKLVQTAGAMPLYADELRWQDEGIATNLMGMASGRIKARMGADAEVRERTEVRKGMLVALSNVTDLYDRVCRSAQSELADAAMARIIHLDIGAKRVFSVPPPAGLERGSSGVFGANYARLLTWRRAEILVELEGVSVKQRDAQEEARFDAAVHELVRIACGLLAEMGLVVDTVYSRCGEALTTAHTGRRSAERRVAQEVFDRVKNKGSRLLAQLSPTGLGANQSMVWNFTATGNGKLTVVELRGANGIPRIFVSDAAIDEAINQTRAVLPATIKSIIDRNFARSAPIARDDLVSFQPPGPSITSRMVDWYFELI